jgi:hypothetical protein
MRYLLWALLILNGCGEPERLGPPALDNLRQLAPGLWSGAAPSGDEAFQELARLGVKTVISVDGAKPDVEAARRQGLRTVHLPIGYDGVPPTRALELAKALKELPGPLYVHCHHGRHRGPAAAAVACVVAGKLDNDQAVEAMKKMGTGEEYLGLWSSARAARRADPELLRALSVEYAEVSAVPPLAEAMVLLDETFERLELCRRAGWKIPPEHPDAEPAHEALRTREILAEILRTDDLRARPADFRSWMEAARISAAELEARLREGSGAESIQKAHEKLRRSCADCHKPYRNAPRN